MASRRGFVLVLVVGIMGLLLLAGVGLLQVATEAKGGSLSACRTIEARLAAASGMDYAASRLDRIGYPRAPDDPATRGDDWTYRAPVEVPLEAAANPSYSHGEPWRNLSFPYALDGIDNDADGDVDEAGEQNERDDDGDGLVDEPDEGAGVHDPREAFIDLDGDGRFTAWSGRLRGGATTHATRFTLRVEGSHGKIPINAGALWKEDYYGGNSSGMGVPDGLPDYNQVMRAPPLDWDKAIDYHLGIAHVLNNLGAIFYDRDPALFFTRCQKVETGDIAGGTPGDPIWVSWLGYDLITKRPPGGYRSLDEVRQALRSPPLGYTTAEIERVIPYLNIGPYEPRQGMSRLPSRNPYLDMAGRPIPFPVYVPIDLFTAPREVLRAMWTYLAVYTSFRSYPGEPAGWNACCTRTGPDGGLKTLTYHQLQFGREISPPRFTNTFTQVIFPDEAEGLADEAVRFRQKGIPSWRDLYRGFVENAPTLFKRDFDDLDGYPVNQRSWTQGKADVAFRAVCVDSHEFVNSSLGLATWASWGIDRDGDPSNAVQPSNASDYVARIRWPTTFPAGPWKGFSPGGDPFAPFSCIGCGFRMEGLSLAPPVQFTIRSAGKAGGRSGAVAARILEGKYLSGEVLEFTSQEDFESLAGGISNVTPRYAYHDPDPESRHGPAADLKIAPSRTPYPTTVTLPRPSRRATTGNVTNALKDGFYGYSPAFGSVVLAPREGGRQGATLYWPLREDFDFDPRLPPVSPPPVGVDYWSESFGWPQYRLKCSDGTVSNPDKYSSALHGSGDISAFTAGMKFQCPGILSGLYIEQLSLEFWAFPGSQLKLWGQPNGGEIYVYCQRDEMYAADPKYGTSFFVEIRWKSDLSTNGTSTSGPFFVPDQPVAPFSTRASWAYHVLLTLQRNLDNTTTVRMYINGRDAEPEFGLPYVGLHPKNLRLTQDEYLSIPGIDEVRIYPGLLGLSEAKTRFALERFRRKGTFTSPLHLLPEETRLSCASHTSIVPPELYEASDIADPVKDPPILKVDADGNPVPLKDPVKVSLMAYETLPGDPLHPKPALGYPAALQDAGTVSDLAATGRIRSFEYRVEIDCEKAAGVMNDTPVFESLWIAFRRASRSRRWSSWQGQ